MTTTTTKKMRWQAQLPPSNKKRSICLHKDEIKEATQEGQGNEKRVKRVANNYNSVHNNNDNNTNNSNMYSVY